MAIKRWIVTVIVAGLLLPVLPSLGVLPVQAGMSSVASSHVTVSPGFDGLNERNANCCNFTPPDVQIAAGPNNVVEFTNDAVQVFNKQGGGSQPQPDSTFFNAGNDFVSDPKVLYDSQSQRFFATIVHCVGATVPVHSCFDTQGPHRIELRVSTSNDPSGGWNGYAITLRVGIFPDQPIIGLSTDKFVVSADMYTVGQPPSPLGAEWWIFNKTALVAGQTTQPESFGPYSRLDAVDPVETSVTTEYMVSVGSSGGSSVQLYSIPTIPPASNASITNSTLTLPDSISMPVIGLENTSGCSPLNGQICYVDPQDARIVDTAWYNGMIWFGTNDACQPNGTTYHLCIRLVEINTGSSSISQEFDFGSMIRDVYYPALSVDGSGNMDMIYGFSNQTLYPSLAVTGQAAGDPSGSLSPSRTIVNGTVYVSATNQSDARYGDYFGAALDPANASQVWVAGEYMNGSMGKCGVPYKYSKFVSIPSYCWDTFITVMRENPGGSFTLSLNPSSVSLACDKYYCDPGSATSTLTVTSVNGFAGTVSLTYAGSWGSVTGPSSVTVSAGGTTSVTITARHGGGTSHTYFWTITGQGSGISASTILTIGYFYCASCL